MKRVFDFLVSLMALIVLAPLHILFMLLIWSQDFKSPFYLGIRMGKNNKPFRMVKYRSMVVQAPKAGVFSTSADDKRITPIGQFVRRYKIDELGQFFNVLVGQMSLVGPRPQVPEEVDHYTSEEMNINTVRPGITDFASIVFSDEGEILKGSEDPDLKYNQVIRPWKSRMALFYIDKQCLSLDITLLCATAMAIVDKEKALKMVVSSLVKHGADPDLIRVAQRQEELTPYPPPGADKIFMWPQPDS